MKIPPVVEKIWNDPVGSKVIAAGIIGAVVWIGQHFGVWFATWPVPGWMLGLLILSILTLTVQLYKARKTPAVTTLERYLQRLQDQDAKIASATGSIPPLVSGELKRLFDEINQNCPALLEQFEGHCNPVALRSQISTAVGRVSARIDASKRG
ncbi:MAG: hypothetical protein WB992_09360 [Bryobacteraceae bacterium]